ncbi:uncharacterized protein [Gossypium hirsutum]|uniref:Retrotransposon gag domain-containing protein n=1 Tax=Gossypium hirsutum TaxID=3635 RepID=A0ABM2ZBQ1_GOSHI|nr:uncharacterized protein LOC121211397 [Gossypium hirsutum]
MSDRPERTEQEEANSRVQTSEQGTSSDIPISMMRERELKNIIYGVMNQWYKEMIQERSQAQPPSPPTAPPVVHPVALPPPSIIETSKRSPIEKLRKFGAEEFRGRSDDDPVKAEYWLQSLVRIFKQIACSSEDYLRCAVSLLKEEAYNWWETVEAVVPAEKLTWEFFQNEFKKKYVGKRYLDKKKREFLDLQQGNKSSLFCQTVLKSSKKYITEKCNEIGKIKSHFKRGASKSFSDLPVKKSREEISQTTSVPGRLGRGRSRQYDFRVFDRPATSQQKDEVDQKKIQRTTPQISRCSGQSSAIGATRSGIREPVSQSENRAPARTYAIRAREEATAPDVIADIFYLYDVTVYALIDPGSTHSYICNMLASEKKLSVESTNYDIQATNPLGQSVMTGEMISAEFGNMKDNVRIISAFSAQKLIRKGNEAFLAYILDTRDSESKLKQLPVVNEFADVFPKELPGLPPYREVEFEIDVILGIAPISELQQWVDFPDSQQAHLRHQSIRVPKFYHFAMPLP